VQIYAVGVLTTVTVLMVACGSPQTSLPGNVVPQYNRDTGRLTSVDVDRDQDGKVDARAYMDGTRLQRVEIDDDDNGKPERWEYYGPATSGNAIVITRAEEASETTGKIARWEYFEGGQLVRVDEDVDEDGRVDKWEHYRAGRLEWLDLDLSGSGKPERRLLYDADGTVRSQSISISPVSGS
jgi:hypothetical protein